jgi:uncharacterized protein YcbK (DUF882 family)
MGDLTKNISRSEMACNCGCWFDSMDYSTLIIVQRTCDYFADKLGLDRVVCNIHSAARCFKYNRTPAVGSDDNSQHPLARAIDFDIEGVAPIEIYEHLNTLYGHKVSLGLYKTFVHIDTRTNGGKRWSGV